MKSPILLFTAAFILQPLSFLLAQGPLTPPGAPAPTMKTLDQIEPRTPIAALPFTISASGSYYVTGNLTGVAGQHGISINADNVTLDLGGFEIVGPGGAATTGIRVQNSHVNVTIRNGTVRGWLSNGVSVDNVLSTDVVVEGVRVLNTGTNGIVLGNGGTAKSCEVRGCVAVGISGGTQCKIIDCSAIAQTGVTGDGISVGVNSRVTGCTAANNGSRGIVTSNGSLIAQCVCTLNTAPSFVLGARSTILDSIADSGGSVGIVASDECTFSNCTVTNHTGGGLSGGTGCTVDNCVSSDNGGAGFSFGDACTLRGCSAYSNAGNGIIVSSDCTIAHCSSESNGGQFGISGSSATNVLDCTVRASTSSSTTSAGINVNTESTVSRCIVSNTDTTAGTLTSITGMGIFVGGFGSTVEHCTVQGCKGDGIRAPGDCLILSNNCEGNGAGAGDGAGIHTTSTGNRIEGNIVTANDRGIEVSSTGSLIIKNSAASNTAADYVIAASNRYGAIINITAGGAAAVNGSAAAGTLTSTDSTANYSY